MSMRQFSIKLIVICFGIFLGFIFIETGFRLLPVNQGLRLLPVNDENPVLRYIPNQTRSWSSGWNLDRAQVIKTNNHGFVSDENYTATDDQPLLAVMGASFVEAPMVASQLKFPTLLAQKVKGKGRVYSFAVSGAVELSSDMTQADYVR